MFRKKIVILFVLLVGLTTLFTVSQTAAAAKVTNLHPPLCTVNFVPGVQYEVYCEDVGKDIIYTEVYFSSGEETYKLVWDDTMMHLVVPLDGDTFAPSQFVWLVGDKDGSVVKGSYP
jgi:hypothetical protein